MNATHGLQPNPFRRLAHEVAEFFAEVSYAQHRMYELSMAPDLFVFKPANAPDTFDEFLFRTSAPLRHEPPAHARACR